MNFAYVKYCLKSFFISDFKQKEISSILNNLEPEIYSREYLKSLKLDPKHEAMLRIQFRVLIDKAYAQKVPLGVELGAFSTLEDAYLYRQQYISQYVQLHSLSSVFSKYLVIVFLACISVLIILFGA